MSITRRSDVIGQIERYLRHDISRAELVDWAERVTTERELDPVDHDAVRDAIARLGLADVRAFGLTWEDCEQLISRVGYRARMTLAPA